MYPNLFSIGPLTIHTYGLFVALGFTVALLVTLRIGKAKGIKTQQVMDMGFIMILMAIIGSRLTYVVMNFSRYRAHPIDIFRIWEGGLVFSGGLVAVVIVMAWYIRRQHLSFWRMGDLWAPGIAIGQAIGRVGCFMAGCCYGKPMGPDFYPSPIPGSPQYTPPPHAVVRCAYWVHYLSSAHVSEREKAIPGTSLHMVSHSS
jgi:phosphatidylglycerol:prolipoprotein diacylglycerol transferase